MGYGYEEIQGEVNVLGNTNQDTGSTVAGGAGIIGGLVSSITQPFMQKWQQDYERHEAGQAWERNQEAWDMQNAYNHPQQQMQRLAEAGLNPNLIYGKGATQTASPIAPFKQPKSVLKTLGQPMGASAPIDIIGKYHAVRKLNEEANAASLTNSAEKVKASVVIQSAKEQLDQVSANLEKTRVGNVKSNAEKNLAATRNAIAQWELSLHQEGFAKSDSPFYRRAISKYSGDATALENMLNAGLAAQAVGSLIPKIGLGRMNVKRQPLKTNLNAPKGQRVLRY